MRQTRRLPEYLDEFIHEFISKQVRVCYKGVLYSSGIVRELTFEQQEHRKGNWFCLEQGSIAGVKVGQSKRFINLDDVSYVITEGRFWKRGGA